MATQTVVHILKRNDPLAIDLILRQSAENPVTVILIQEAAREVVGLAFPTDAVSIFVLQDDASENRRYPLVDYPKMLDMILAADQVLVW